MIKVLYSRTIAKKPEVKKTIEEVPVILNKKPTRGRPKTKEYPIIEPVPILEDEVNLEFEKKVKLMEELLDDDEE